MGKVKFTQTMSLDGYTAGPEQTREEPLGEGGEELHEWMFATRTFREMGGREGGDTGLDDERMRRWNENVGAHIMGRNMFGPVRGEWGDETGGAGGATTRRTMHQCSSSPTTGVSRSRWRVARRSTSSRMGSRPRSRTRKKPRGEDVAIAGGASTLQQYLHAGLVDEMEIHVVPMLLGAGERLFENLDGGPAGFECVELVSSPAVAHYSYVRKGP